MSPALFYVPETSQQSMGRHSRLESADCIHGGMIKNTYFREMPLVTFHTGESGLGPLLQPASEEG